MNDKKINSIEVTNVTKVYNTGTSSTKALKNANLTIYDNEFFTLLGPSGCGKTTLLRLIAGFEDITEGTIKLFNEEIVNLPPNKRPINTVFQHYALFPHLNVFENVAFGLRRLNKENNLIEKRTMEVLDLIQMKDYATRKSNQLSGGQQQRVALARALAPKPKVLLLDEPLSALDLKLRQAMRVELKTLQRETGITFVFVTHQSESQRCSRRRRAIQERDSLPCKSSSPRDPEHPQATRGTTGILRMCRVCGALGLPYCLEAGSPPEAHRRHHGTKGTPGVLRVRRGYAADAVLRGCHWPRSRPCKALIRGGALAFCKMTSGP